MVNTSDPSPGLTRPASGELPNQFSSIDEPVLHRPPRRVGPVGRADLRVEVLDVPVRGLRGDEELLADLARRTPLRGQAQYVDLARAETPGPSIAALGQR